MEKKNKNYNNKFFWTINLQNWIFISYLSYNNNRIGETTIIYFFFKYRYILFILITIPIDSRQYRKEMLKVAVTSKIMQWAFDLDNYAISQCI